MKLKNIRYKIICLSCGHHEIKELITTVGLMLRKTSSDQVHCSKCGSQAVRVEKQKK